MKQPNILLKICGKIKKLEIIIIGLLICSYGQKIELRKQNCLSSTIITSMETREAVDLLLNYKLLSAKLVWR